MTKIRPNGISSVREQFPNFHWLQFITQDPCNKNSKFIVSAVIHFLMKKSSQMNIIQWFFLPTL